MPTTSEKCFDGQFVGEIRNGSSLLITVNRNPAFYGVIKSVTPGTRVPGLPSHATFEFFWGARMGNGTNSGSWRSVGKIVRQKVIRFGLPMKHGRSHLGAYVIIEDGNTTYTVFLGHNHLNPRDVLGLPEWFM